MSARDPRLAGLALGAALLAMPFVAAPLGHLASPFALLVVLPVFARALEAFGWSRAAGSALRRFRAPMARLLAAYLVWLATSALLTLDVAATAGATVGIDVAGPDERAQRWHMGAAILGSNVGSLLLPFSNLTNLVVVGATGIGLGAYVAAVWLPQVGAALAVGLLLAVRAHRSGDVTMPDADPRRAAGAPAEDGPSVIAGLIAIGSAVGSIMAGLAGLDMAVPFAIGAALLAGSAVARRAVVARDVVRGLPIAALAVVGLAAVIGEPLATGASFVPRPPDDVLGLAIALALGGLLAATFNNLPAAAFGAAWLAHSPAPIIVAYLVGTNIAALATPHGSAATMLVRSIASRREVPLPARGHVRTAWRYALTGSVTAGGLLAAGIR